MSLLNRVLAVAFAAAERLRGEQVVYQWDAATVLLVPAVLGRTLWQMEESPGAFVSVQGADFMIDAALFPASRATARP